MKITIEPKDGKWDIEVVRSDGNKYVNTQNTQVEVVKWLANYLEISFEVVLRMME
jgi:hypothetical protein